MNVQVKDKRLTPKGAILVECRWCQNTPVFHGCVSQVCKLNDKSLSYTKRIKAHCLTCTPEQSVYGVKACTGEVSNFNEGRNCPLYAFRLGKNPARQEASRKRAENAPITGLLRTRFKPKERGKGILGV